MARGETAHLEAIARRIIPSTGSININYGSGRHDVFAITGQPDATRHGARFSFDVVNAQESFDYQFKLNDNRTAALHVNVQSAPLIQSLLFQQHYPDYLQLPDAPESPSQLSFVQGAKLKLTLTASSALAGSAAPVRSHIHLIGSEQDIPIEVNAADPTNVSLVVPFLPQTTGLAIRLVDVNGLQNKNPMVYPISVLPDSPPTINLIYPISKEVTATHRAQFLIGFAGHDDFGICSLTLHYIVDKDHEQTKSQDIKKASPELRGRFEWDLTTLPPPAGKTDVVDSTIEYWLEAKDANTLTGPGIGSSEHYTVHIVTDAQKRAELALVEQEILQGIRQARDDESTVAGTLGDIVIEKK